MSLKLAAHKEWNRKTVWINFFDILHKSEEQREIKSAALCDRRSVTGRNEQCREWRFWTCTLFVVLPGKISCHTGSQTNDQC